MVYLFELISPNDHQIVMRLKYDVNGYLGHMRVTSDDFLTKIRWLHRNVMKFHEKIIRHSKSFQKVIRNDPETYFVKKKNFFSSKNTEMSWESKILIGLSWDRNMMLTGCMRPSGSLLMTFWKKFDGRIEISRNFMKKSCGLRKVFKKSSEVNQRRFNI